MGNYFCVGTRLVEETFESQLRNLEDLPVELISTIFHYLLKEDILNVRKVSKKLYNASKGPLFYKQIKFQIATLSEKDKPYLKNMFKQSVSLIPLDIRFLPTGQIKYLLPYFGVIEDISIDLKDLPEICVNCKSLRRLTVRFDVCLSIEHREAFSCIQRLKNLEKLLLEDELGNNEDDISGKSYLFKLENSTNHLRRKLLLMSALKYSRGTVRNIEFIGLIFPVHNNEKEDKELQQIIHSSNHIKYWNFVNFSTSRNVMVLPSSKIYLKIRGGIWYDFNLHYALVETLILNKTDCLRMEKGRKDYPDVKTLELHNMSLQGFADKQLSFPNVENLVIGSPASFSTRLFFENFIPLFKSSIKKLTLISFNGINDIKLDMILEQCVLLTDLILIGMKNISREFLITLKTHSNLNIRRE